jgi:transcription antitermination factor NusG
MHWFCIRTKTAKESQVAAYCRDVLGLEAYYPLLRAYRTMRGLRRLEIGPLFPRYLFCRFDPGESFRAVRYAPNAVEIVQFGGEPALVAESLIEDLKQWSGQAVDGFARPSDFQTGGQVQIKQGPLRGLTGVILRARDDDDRVEILLSLLQDGVKATLQRDQLELVRTG